MKKPRNKGISTVAGSVLFIILIFVVQTTLFLTVYRYNSSVQDAIKTENERIQEKIVLTSLETDQEEGGNIIWLVVNNTGSITVRIRAIYIDNQFLCDPSDKSINPTDTYVNAKETSLILMPPDTPYNPTSKITAATERGTKSTDYEWRLKEAGGGRPPYEAHKFYLGPLMLDFIKFYYAKIDSQGNLTSEWIPGWRIETSTGSVAWNITVKNIDDRDITINQFCSFTLWANDQPSNRLPWYFEPPPNSLSQRIKVNETVQLIYKWVTPKTNSTKLPRTQSIYTTDCRCRTILTFFGIFHEKDGTTKPYGQTIPFEAVLVEKLSITITATPNVIVIGSTMTSIIEAVVTRNAKPVVGESVTFTTTAGTLSSSWTLTDANGIATVTLSAQGMTIPADALVTATWATWTDKKAFTTVRLVKETITITASPAVIVVNSTMKSTITVTVKAETTPIAGANITFTTNASSLSSSWAITDINGVATVELNAGTSPTVANVTAIWINTLGSTTVRFAVETIQATASPTVIVVNSTIKSTITAVVKVEGTSFAGANVTFATTAGTLSSSWAITDATGTAKVYLTTDTSPTTATVTAKWINTLDSTTVNMVLETITVTASPTVIVVNSAMKSTITAVVEVDGTPLEGAEVTFATDAGTLSPLSAITDTNGIARVNLTAGTYPTVANVTAIWLNKQGSTTVQFVVETVQTSASPTVIATNSSMTSTITTVVMIGSEPAVGANVTFTSDAGSLSSFWAITDDTGMAKVNLTAGMTPAVANVTAEWINTSNSTTVRFTNLYVTTDKAIYTRTENATISGLLRDVDGAPIPGVNVTINIRASNGTVIWTVNATTDSGGFFTCELDLELINALPDIYTVVVTYQTYEESYHQFEVTE